MARTAVVAGTATAVSNRVSRRQANRWAAKEEQQQAAAQPQYQEPPPQYQQPQYQQPQYQQPQYQQPQPVYEPAPAEAAPAASTSSMLDQLTQLGELKTAGVLTDQEFETQKARILAGG
jgi:hypothetical protein